MAERCTDAGGAGRTARSAPLYFGCLLTYSKSIQCLKRGVADNKGSRHHRESCLSREDDRSNGSRRCETRRGCTIAAGET
ncbi:hypothetical protein E2C01_096024 [Portunus trituberculatus]|uniref:Uncharacterized protein n=1 Tax=Portunus trituberculatus TaxID=210409 RepID=A0A5B7K0X8_PORTR|nr:hypothetical protein [Portunus trituberculatus]